MNIEKDVIETLNKTIKFYEDLDILYNSKEPCPEIRAIRWIITAYEKEKEKNKELKKENKQLNLVRLQYLVSSFPDTTETYKKYKKELDEAISNLKEE